MTREKQCLLVVEDELLIRMALAQTLEDAGYDVIEAGNGLEAIAAIAGDARIDAIITDVDMPGGISGLDIARMAKLAGSIVPVLVMSGREHDLSAAGIDDADFILKPCRTEDLLSRLADRLEGVAARAADPSRMRA